MSPHQRLPAFSTKSFLSFRTSHHFSSFLFRYQLLLKFLAGSAVPRYNTRSSTQCFRQLPTPAFPSNLHSQFIFSFYECCRLTFSDIDSCPPVKVDQVPYLSPCCLPLPRLIKNFLHSSRRLNSLISAVSPRRSTLIIGSSLRAEADRAL